MVAGVLRDHDRWHQAQAKTIADVRKYETVAGLDRSHLADRRLSAPAERLRRHEVRIVTGSPAPREIMLAMERREVDALENSWTSVVRTQKEWVDGGKINVLIQAALERSKELPDTPTLVEMGDSLTPGGARLLYELGRGEPLVAGHARYSGGSAQGSARCVPGDHARSPQFLTEVEQSQSEFDSCGGSIAGFGAQSCCDACHDRAADGRGS